MLQYGRLALRSRQLWTLGFPHRHYSHVIDQESGESHARHVLEGLRRIVFSGIQPTGVPHLGNYLGTLRQWVHLQDDAKPSDQLLFCVADLHAITTPQSAADLRLWRRGTLAALIAIGLDPGRCALFYQSAVAEHTELMWTLACIASTGQLSRMTQWKSKSDPLNEVRSLEMLSNTANLKLGLFAYPVLQAADILLYGATHVPIGQDQTQHLELTRDYADSFNSLYGNIFVKPTVLLTPARRVMSLKKPGLKMSKSHADPRSRIDITDTPEEVALKVRLALTDSTDEISYEPSTRPGVSNLLDIMSHLDRQRRSPTILSEIFRSYSMRNFKTEVTRSITDALAGMRKKYSILMNNDNAHYLEDVAREGARVAQERAATTMSRVRDAIGTA